MTLWAYPGEPLRDHLLAVARIGRELFPGEAELFERRAGLPWEYVAYFHDVGKAHVAYQSGEVGNYECHEVYSAAVAYMVLRKWGELGARAAAVAALLHHHAMERLARCARIRRERPNFVPAEGLDELLSELLGRAVCVGKVSDVWRVVEHVASDRRAYAAAQIALGPLVVADNIAASKRGGKPPKIVQEIAAELPAIAFRSPTGIHGEIRR